MRVLLRQDRKNSPSFLHCFSFCCYFFVDFFLVFSSFSSLLFSFLSPESSIILNFVVFFLYLRVLKFFLFAQFFPPKKNFHNFLQNQKTEKMHVKLQESKQA